MSLSGTARRPITKRNGVRRHWRRTPATASYFCHSVLLKDGVHRHPRRGPRPFRHQLPRRGLHRTHRRRLVLHQIPRRQVRARHPSYKSPSVAPLGHGTVARYPSTSGQTFGREFARSRPYAASSRHLCHGDRRCHPCPRRRWSQNDVRRSPPLLAGLSCLVRAWPVPVRDLCRHCRQHRCEGRAIARRGPDGHRRADLPTMPASGPRPDVPSGHSSLSRQRRPNVPSPIWAPSRANPSPNPADPTTASRTDTKILCRNPNSIRPRASNRIRRRSHMCTAIRTSSSRCKAGSTSPSRIPRDHPHRPPSRSSPAYSRCRLPRAWNRTP
jgi:hypothetical protein